MNLNKIKQRDQRINFNEKTHTYYIDGTKYPFSVTEFIHSFFETFESKKIIEKFYHYWQSNEKSKYFGMSSQEILDHWELEKNKASTLGTQLHKEIETFYTTGKAQSKSDEFQLFLDFYEDHIFLTPLKTEWMIFDEELKIAGSVDMLFKDKDKLCLYDWKRSKEIKETNQYKEGMYPLTHIADSNYWHYALQLNCYKAIIERNYELKIDEMKIAIFHPKNKKYLLYSIPNLQKEIKQMFSVLSKNNSIEK